MSKSAYGAVKSEREVREVRHVTSPRRASLFGVGQ